MKKLISLVFALFTLALADLAMASALVTTATGNTQVQSGTAPARPLRVGDRVNQGDTVSTGASSSLVLKFDDGQVTALTANSRLTVTAFQYSPQTQRGNVLLSLVNGGMRLVSGLIGKNQPQNVAVRAVTATIGIRGTDISVTLQDGNVLLTVNDGQATFTVGGQTVTVAVNTGAFLGANGRVTQGAINQLVSQLGSTPEGTAVLNTLGGLQGLTQEINKAIPGTPPSGGQGQGQGQGQQGTPGLGTGSGQGTPSGPTGPTGGGGGGGTGSPN
jgi:hypothetical protein